MTTIEDFEKIEIRIGTVIKCLPFSKAKKPAYQVWIDLGEELGIKKSSAQITSNYKPADVVGLQVVCVVNLPPRQISDFLSEVLITGFKDENGNVVLCSALAKVPNGSKLY